MMRKTLILLLLTTSYQLTFAQQKELGIKFGLHFFQLSGQGKVGKYQVINDNYADQDGSHIGVYYRQYYKRNKFYLQAELQYAINLESAVVINTNPGKYYTILSPGFPAVEKSEWVVNIHGRYYRRLELPLICGFSLWKPSKWLNLRAYTGLVPAYLFDDFAYSPDDNLPQTQIMYDLVKNTTHRWALDYIFGSGLDIWNITLDVRYTGGLTRLSTETKYEGKAYSFRQKSNALFFSLGIQIK